MPKHDLHTDNDFRVLDALSRTPYAEHRELTAFAGLPPSSALDSLRRLHAGGLADFVRHIRTDTSRVRRWHVVPRGVTRLARHLGTTGDALARERPVSAEWLSVLLQRLDAVAALYLVAHEVAMCGGSLKFRWQGGDPLDALVEFPDGRMLAVMRFGRTLTWKEMRRRVGGLYGLQRVRRCPPALLLVPGGLEVQRLGADLRGRAIAAFAAAEDDLTRAAPGAAVWRSLDSPQGLTLEQALAGSRSRLEIAGMGGSASASLPAVDLTDDVDLTATELSMPARRLLDALYDWPLMSSEHLEALLGMSEAMLKKTRAFLIERELACLLRIGTTPELRRLNGSRLCQAADGVSYLARRDGSSEDQLLALWGVTRSVTGDERLEVKDYRVDGSGLGVLVGQLSHTDGVSELVAMFAVACRDAAGWRLLQALPPHRWERWFTYDGTWRCVRPDAVLDIEHRRVRRQYVLEYEQSAIRPSTMREKLKKYLRYFGSMETHRDFDSRRATLLIVFAEEETAGSFCRVAARAAPRPVPLLVSSREKLSQVGMLGQAWRSPWRFQDRYVSLAAMH